MLGTLLDGRYQVVQLLGAGSFSQTYLAQDTRRPGQPTCVVKHLLLTNHNSVLLQNARRLFNSEAETLEQLGKHDKIPQLLAYFEENQEFFLIQEFIKGQPLSAELQPNQRWNENQVIQLLQQVLSILKFVHSHGVIHRDIKPDNLIRREQDGQLVLIDFGAVKLRTQLGTIQGQASDTIVIGTSEYMPLEQGEGRPRPSSDIYALGKIGIQALTGVPPRQFEELDPNTGEILWQHQTQVSSTLAAVLKQMVRYDFQDRYQSATDVLNALQCLPSLYPSASQSAFTGNLPVPPTNANRASQQNMITASPANPLGPSSLPRHRRHRLEAGIMLLLGFSLTLGLGVWWLLWSDSFLKPSLPKLGKSHNPSDRSPASASAGMSAKDFNNQGLDKAKKGEFKQAIEDYTRALRLNPNRADVYRNRGDVRSALGDYQAAIEDYQKAAEIYQKQGRTNEAQTVLDQVNKLEL